MERDIERSLAPRDGGGSGASDGTVSFSADSNPGPLRVGMIVVGDKTFTVSQAAVGTVTGRVP